MSRASRRNNTESASLFPFLAVLLCTMGVLVVLLVVMASVQLNQAKNQSKTDNARRQAAYDSPEQQLLREQMADLEKGEQLLNQRQSEADKFRQEADQRLSQVEENIRRRQERLAILRAQIDELQGLSSDAVDDVQKAKERLDQQLKLIATTKQEVEDLKKKQDKSAKFYAIVPYAGSGGTRRQPVYIECQRDQVIFQPEGIVLTAADFDTAAGASAPLPAAIRAVQRYYINHGLSEEQVPYPLVIVRPEASGSFARVLGMLSEVDVDFGYEIVAMDWTFDYSAADPALAIEIQQAVVNARSRMASLKQSAPDQFAGGTLESFDPGPSLLDRIKSGDLPPSYTPVGVRGSGSGESTVMLSREPIDMNRLAGVFEAAASQPGPGSTAGMPAGQELKGGSPGGPDSMGSGGSGGGPSNIKTVSAPTPAQTPAGSKYDRYAEMDAAAQNGEGTGENGAKNPGGNTASAPTGAPTGAALPANSAVAGNAAAPSNSTPNQSSADMSNTDPMQANQMAGNPQGSNSQQGSSGQSQSGGANSSLVGGGGEPQKSGPTGSSPQSPSAPGMALVRTIRVQVEPKQLVVLSGKISPSVPRPAPGDKAIPLDANAQEAAKTFITAIQKEIRDWGIAGNGLYWQPVLEITVAPGGEQLAEQLSGLLRQSGVECRIAQLPSADNRFKDVTCHAAVK